MSGKKPGLNGVPLSKVSRKPSTKKTRDLERILESIYSAFQKHEDRNINALMKRDFVFHMTDWENDLHRLNQLFQNPTGYSKTEAKDIVAGFLLHASSHIKMAVSLLLDFVPFDFEDPRKNRG